jgi:hypothetical protein
MSRFSVQLCHGMQEVSAHEASETMSACVVGSVISVESNIFDPFCRSSLEGPALFERCRAHLFVVSAAFETSCLQGVQNGVLFCHHLRWSV